MGPRPQPNPVRGLLRAAIVVVALVAIILVVLIALQSLYAPPAKAPASPPTVPATPGPHATPHLVTTPHPKVTPVPRATPTARKKSLGLLVRRSRYSLAEASGASVFAQVAPGRRRWPANSVPSPDGRSVAWFQGNDAYRSRLLVTSSTSGLSRFAAYADPLVRPVWSHDGQSLLFVRVMATTTFPGARWSLYQLDTVTLRTSLLAEADAMSLVPLGWSSGRVLYLVGTSADTSVYSHTAGGNHLVSVVLPQPVASAALSPNGRFVATASPTNCSNSCTVIVFDTQKLTAWYGPSGIARETDLAWLPNSRQLLTFRQGRLAVLDVVGRTVRTLAALGVPAAWPHPMQATRAGGTIRLHDTIDGTTFVAHP